MMLAILIGRILFLVLFIYINSSFAEEIIDLGEDGFVCPLNPAQLKQEYSEEITHAVTLNPVSQNPIDISFHSNLKKHIGPAKINKIPKGMLSTIPSGTKIFFFSADDTQSIEIAPQISANYGLCVNYNSLEDIADFQQKAGIKYPVQPATQDYINTFKIGSYPALVTIKDNEIEIQEGF